MTQSNDKKDTQKRQVPDITKAEPFTLPRLDWHDNEGMDLEANEIIGRIYKDALIENFNAIEDKCNELQKLDILDIPIPEPVNVIYPDVDLKTGADNQIINLKSLYKILNLRGYPLELSFTSNICTKCKYYRLTSVDEIEIVELSNINTGANDTNKYIYLDSDAGTIQASSSPSLTTPKYLIGVFVEGKVIHQRSPLYPSSTTIKGS